MNWGKSLVAGMATFMLFIIGMGVYMFSRPTDDYDKQYYEKGLSFDQDYAREKQVVSDKAQPLITFASGEMIVKFTEPADGVLKFRRSADRSMDKSFSIATDAENAMRIPLSQLSSGQWQLHFEWASRQKEYLYEQEVYLQ
ncbi:FixH family protein [Mucilaginibacter sp. Bleaf8]|uniref:FixH family protein n=1 Tax=Mucilaginibacter sp. Bleaf8 TaxID=2834430 RepID=UPI001BCB2779|nr:FixH family protein [Mucilaginibacter sp. Bleaf8]MBS7563325.1 FixH family protein [Mucilaginibacter sp. Bleaf8]